MISSGASASVWVGGGGAFTAVVLLVTVVRAAVAAGVAVSVVVFEPTPPTKSRQRIAHSLPHSIAQRTKDTTTSDVSQSGNRKGDKLRGDGQGLEGPARLDVFKEHFNAVG